MQRYAIKLTIGGMTGAFAEKYARLVRDAQVLDALLQESTASSGQGPITLLAAHPEPTPFDGFTLLPRLMQQLRRVSLEHAQRPFFTGARLEPTDGREPTPWSATLEARDSDGPVTVHALGRRATLERPGAEPERLLPSAEDADQSLTRPLEGATLRVRFDTRHALFRDDLEALVNMCEEVLAKDQPLIATCIPMDAVEAGDDAVSGAGLPRYDEL